jgi:hypothetical protein
MRRRHLRVPAVGGEQYRRTRTKAIHVLSRVVLIIIIIWYCIHPLGKKGYQEYVTKILVPIKYFW